MLSIIITLAFVLGEGVAGSLSHSLALMSDAGHNFADALALVFSWYGLWVSKRPATARRTYGYHRVAILAAFANAVSLVVIALLIFWEAAERLRAPQPVASGVMIAVALVAIAMNMVISFWLRGGAEHDLNVRSAYLHMVGDAVSAAGVVVAGIVVALTGALRADPLVSILIGILILWSSWGILRESVNVLLESVPEGLDMAALEQVIGSAPGVLAVHDLHVWTVGPGAIACSCHVLVAEQSVRSGEQVLRVVVEKLDRRFGINHATIQVEVEGCEPNEMYCAIKPANAEHPEHYH